MNNLTKIYVQQAINLSYLPGWNWITPCLYLSYVYANWLNENLTTISEERHRLISSFMFGICLFSFSIRSSCYIYNNNNNNNNNNKDIKMLRYHITADITLVTDWLTDWLTKLLTAWQPELTDLTDICKLLYHKPTWNFSVI